ncbi:hypothetical protein Nepgr_022994 [Nepenthes gracilis]|uniref:Uncharacterized protein n=1 Tax=Nepenthes gracilis TaxID=150966 RepID=A0AAD3T322_NEPGR|nr:hypothetical protein Nepgr_022994 [Nepenthes gracilis]
MRKQQTDTLPLEEQCDIVGCTSQSQQKSSNLVTALHITTSQRLIFARATPAPSHYKIATSSDIGTQKHRPKFKVVNSWTASEFIQLVSPAICYTQQGSNSNCNTHLYPYPLFHEENNQQPRNQSSCQTNHLHAHQQPQQEKTSMNPQQRQSPSQST